MIDSFDTLSVRADRADREIQIDQKRSKLEKRRRWTRRDGEKNKSARRNEWLFPAGLIKNNAAMRRTARWETAE